MAAPASPELSPNGKDRLGSGSGGSKHGAAPWDPSRSGELLRSFRSRSRSLPCPAARSSADCSAQQSVARPRLQSVAVHPSAPEVNITAPEEGPEWQLVTSRRERGRAPSPLPAARRPTQGSASARWSQGSSSRAAAEARAAFLRRFHGLCFRCLSSRHRRVDCRDPLRCIECRQWGHSSSSPRCPNRAKPKPQPQPLRERLRFPAPPPDKEMSGQIKAIPAPRRSASGHTVIMSTRAMDHEVLSLRSRGVVLQAVEQYHAANPFAVGHALESALRLPRHALRVTRHHPEAFFVRFDLPRDRDAAVRLGRINVDGYSFLLKPWHEADHGVHQTANFHARVCIERMPLQLWNLEGAVEVLGKHVVVDRLDSRTYGQENTAIFSCWVWCWKLDNIPSSHAFTVYPEGSGRIVEMLGYSPPSRQVAPPPDGIRYDAMVHLDLVEDWSIPYRRTPSSGQSGIPSSGSEEEPPLPRVQPYTWRMGVPDGEETRRAPAPRICNNNSFNDRRRDDEGDSSDGRRRTWQEATYQRGREPRAAAHTAGTGGERHRTRSPAEHRRRQGSAPRRPVLESEEMLPPPPPLPSDGSLPQLAFPPPLVMATPMDVSPPAAQVAATTTTEPAVDDAEHPRAPSPRSGSEPDPLADFLVFDRFDSDEWSPRGVDPMCLELDAFCMESTQVPLSFSPQEELVGPFLQGPGTQTEDLDAAAGLGCDDGLGSTTTPGQATLSQPIPIPMAHVTAQVGNMSLSDVSSPLSDALQGLFAAPPSSILGATPSPPTPRAQTRAKFAGPVRRSPRIASPLSAVPVAQRATLRLAKEMAVIDPAEASAAKAATALTGHFGSQLSDTDLDGIAILTRVDREAMLRAASQAEAASAAAAAH